PIGIHDLAYERSCPFKYLDASGEPQLRERALVLSTEELFTLGEFHGRLARSLEGFHHPAASRTVAWNLSNGLVLGDWLRTYLPASLWDEFSPLLKGFAAKALPSLPRMRSRAACLASRQPSGLERIDAPRP